MICPECQAVGDDHAATCVRCGAPWARAIACRRCHNANRPQSRFCDQCGHSLAPNPGDHAIESERKHVSVLFADISHYREIVDHVDPEEIREATRQLFEATVKIVSRFEGHVDRILWDGILAVFGMPHSHEDDSIRAIRAAMEIQHMVARRSRGVADRIGRGLSMRSGVATGLVVTGSTEARIGQHGITGDTVNLAARLRDMAGMGEILVDGGAFSAAGGFFTFQPMTSVTVKGRQQPVTVYRVRSAIAQPHKVHRVHGLKARLVGRDNELKQLANAALQLQRKVGTVVTICGDAGTGKSRLINEFKQMQTDHGSRWLDGRAYAYTGEIPYYPFIDMLNGLFGIREADEAAVVAAKLQSGIQPLVGDPAEVVPFLSRLYAIASAEESAPGPQVYKSKLQNAFIDLLSALSRQGPTIVCIEDLHWADPSSLALIRFILEESGLPLMFVISYRPTLDLADGEHSGPFAYARRRILLRDLDHAASREMVCSLMETPHIPEALDRYIREQVEGNPFYIEEVINSLLDSNRLRREGSRWLLDGSFDIGDISANIDGIIHGRLDRLGKKAKTILQEASVVGRVFRLDLLVRITVYPESLSACIGDLERLDLIRRLPDASGPAYRFKHAIVQEVVYNGLLKRRRRLIHERIARNLEIQFHGRTDGVLETLARHYANSDCVDKAAAYLTRCGDKSLEKYSVDESYRYYEKAYHLLNGIDGPTADQQAMLIDLIIRWYFAFNKLGLFREMLDLLRSHEPFVNAFGDPLRAGMYDVCMGWALQRRELVRESYVYLNRARDAGRRLGDDNLIAYSSACLCWTCTDLGRMDEALACGTEAAEVADRMATDHELIRFNLTGMGLRHFFRGDIDACWQTGENLLRLGERVGDERTFSEGYLLMGSARMAAGDFVRAESLLTKAIDAAVEPIYSLNARFFLSYVYFSQGRIQVAAQALESVIDTTEQYGYEYVGTSANAFYGIVSATMGDLAKGVALIRGQIQRHRRLGKRNHDLIFTHMLGKFYLGLVRRRGGALNARLAVSNIAFLLRSLPVAARLAERYLLEAIDIGKEIDSRVRQAQAYLDLGRLYVHQRRFSDARNQLDQGIRLLEQCGADVLLAEARGALRDIPG